MDPITLAASVTTFLAPYLLKAGAKLADEAVEHLPAAVGALWKTIADRFKSKPEAAAAANDLTAKADEPDNQADFRKQLRKLLEQDPAFAQQMEGQYKQAEASVSINVEGDGAAATGGSVAAGRGGIAVGGSVSGSIVVGSNNTVSSGKPGEPDKS
jgi:hypothetical protein